MAGKDADLILSGTDFDQIKSNLLVYLRSQDILKDADYTGSVLSILLDVLAYNTHYNAYYLNMVANELFLDSAVKRSSVISHAKTLGYSPRSYIAPTAVVNLIINNYDLSSVTIPKFTRFLSESVDGENYTFVTTQEYNANNDSANDYTSPIIIENVNIKQGEPVVLSFTNNSKKNASSIFKIPDPNIDLESLEVVVQKSRTNSSEITVYKRSLYVLGLNPKSEVFFVQESLDGFYEIYFGDGILGKKLADGNIIRVSYITTEGSVSNGTKKFNIIGENEKLASGNITVETVTPATNGSEKESIDSIKFAAPKAYSAQNRAVSEEDYITMINNNNQGFSFDSVNVWGGQENDPPVYGQVFVALKPTGGYTLTTPQKEIIKQKIIRPLNVVTVEPQILDPDYNYIKIVANVVCDLNKTTLTTGQLSTKIKAAIQSFANINLNTFNSVFSFPNLMYAIQQSDSCVVTNECQVTLQKKFLPNLTVPTNYEFSFDCALERGILSSGINSTPGMSFYDKQSTVQLINGLYLEEIPSYAGGVERIQISNPGYGYKTTPIINIVGDGLGANAYAVIVNGSLNEIIVDNPGANYSQATVEIVGGSGNLGSAVAILEGRYGTIKSYYYNSKNIKTTYNPSAGIIDYLTGTITLTNFNPQNVNNPLGQLTLSVKPKSNIIYSKRNKILTVDPYDPTSIVVNVIVKS